MPAFPNASKSSGTTESSGATGGKPLSWAKVHHCWPVRDPLDLAILWADLVIGVETGGGVAASPLQPQDRPGIGLPAVDPGAVRQ